MSSDFGTTRSEVPAEISSSDFGVYVHIPFCTHKCDYCAFATWTDRAHLVESYIDAVVAHLELAARSGELLEAKTVFIGGGTPSLIAPDGIERILSRVPRVQGAEVTIECNPDTVDLEKFRGYRAAGVNRVSLGVQSMVPHVLAALGRTHDPANVRSAVDAARLAEVSEVSVDLIYGAAGESVDDWAETLTQAVALEPTHISAYGLTVEAGTPLADDHARHPDDDDQADKYVMADDAITAAGLANYEISNWAKPGSESSHNRLYWCGANYLGVGCAAHSHRDGRRYWNLRTPERYIAAVADGTSVVAADEVLDDETRRVETAQLRLRTREGVPTAEFGGTGPPLAIRHLIDDDGTTVRLTREGRLLANEVAIRIGDRKN